MHRVAMRRTRLLLPNLLLPIFVIPNFLLALVAGAAGAQELTFTTENDIFSTQPARDDLHTFAVEIEVEGAGHLFAFREEAFTDRDAGLRFDESQVSIGRALPEWRSWAAHAEAGAVRIGRGLFGQDVQNQVHRVTGGDEVDLPYLGPSLHGRFAFAAERSFAARSASAGLAAGPRLELEWVSGVRAHAIVAGQFVLRPNDRLAFHALVGGRWSDASLAALDRRTEPFGAVARFGVSILERIVLDWSYNDHGDGRTHLALGYRFANWRAGRDARIR